MIRDKEKLTEAIKISAHLIAAILSESEEIVNDRLESGYTQKCAKITAYEHIVELLTKQCAKITDYEHIVELLIKH